MLVSNNSHNSFEQSNDVDNSNNVIANKSNKSNLFKLKSNLEQSFGKNQIKELNNIIIMRNSFFHNIDGMGLWKSRNVDISKYLRVTSNDLVEQRNDVSEKKSKSTIVHVGTSDFTNGANLLVNVKNVLDETKINTRIYKTNFL